MHRETERVFMDVLRASEREGWRLTLPSLAIGAALGALAVLGTVLAIILGGGR
jgi:hypothetical protein